MDEVSEEYIKYLLTSAPRAMSLVKELVGFEVENDHDSNVMEAVKTFKACLHGEEFRHGIKCRSKKQKPDWGAFYRQKQLQSQGKLASKL